jgi:hypothetical protein
MKIVVFLGPTLTLDEAKSILPDAIYLPPAAQSDLMSAVCVYRPQVIGLIDGVFSQSLSVWHKEILFALDEGIYVYGASSMGALRAAETDVYGTIGIGSIYKKFQQGEWTDDDEVALAHASAEDQYRNFSEPMVNIRDTLNQALEMEVISRDVHDTVIACAKSLYFPERTFPTIFKLVAAQGVPRETITQLEAFVQRNYINLKRQDAIELLRTLADLPDDIPPFAADFEFNRSQLFNALYERDRLVSRPTGEVHLDSVANYAALHLPDFLTFNVDALNRKLTLVLADMLKVQVSDSDVSTEARRFRVRLKLKTREQFDAWLQANDLSEAEFNVLMQENALSRELHRWLLTRQYVQGNTRILLDQLRLQNRYAEIADKAASQAKTLHEVHPMFLQDNHSHITLQSLVIDHLQKTDCHMDVPYEIWLEEAGFSSAPHLWIELLKTKLVRDVIGEPSGDSVTGDRVR